MVGGQQQRISLFQFLVRFCARRTTEDSYIDPLNKCMLSGYVN